MVSEIPTELFKTKLFYPNFFIRNPSSLSFKHKFCQQWMFIRKPHAPNWCDSVPTSSFCACGVFLMFTFSIYVFLVCIERPLIRDTQSLHLANAQQRLKFLSHQHLGQQPFKYVTPNTSLWWVISTGFNGMTLN